jgi:hypothetical protein
MVTDVRLGEQVLVTAIIPAQALSAVASARMRVEVASGRQVLAAMAAGVAHVDAARAAIDKAVSDD